MAASWADAEEVGWNYRAACKKREKKKERKQPDNAANGVIKGPITEGRHTDWGIISLVFGASYVGFFMLISVPAGSLVSCLS